MRSPKLRIKTPRPGQLHRQLRGMRLRRQLPAAQKQSRRRSHFQKHRRKPLPPTSDFPRTKRIASLQYPCDVIILSSCASLIPSANPRNDFACVSCAEINVQCDVASTAVSSTWIYPSPNIPAPAREKYLPCPHPESSKSSSAAKAANYPDSGSSRFVGPASCSGNAAGSPLKSNASVASTPAA